MLLTQDDKQKLNAMAALPLLCRKKSDSGFTLVELLVVVIVIGILAAIALPSFLSQAAKAKMSEAKTAVGATNRAQQAYRIENSAFAASFEDLEIGLPTATENYTYTIDATGGESATIATTTEDNTLKNFSGGVFVTSAGLTSTAACQTKSIATPAALPVLVGEDATCTGDTEPMR